MQIEVDITYWEQACCGVLIRVGDQTTLRLLAVDPASATFRVPPRFEEEHHGQTPPDVPHWPVTGTVSAIEGLRYARIPTPGLAGVHTWDTSQPTSQALGSVGEPAEPAFDQFRVILDVPDDTTLPAFQLGANTIAQSERDAHTANRNRERMRDEVGVLLEALADDAQRRYADVARASRAADRSAMTVEPHRNGAASIRWIRSAGDVDGITVQVGEGTWRLPAARTDAAFVSTFLEAAAAGRVYEHVRPVGSPAQRLETEVLADDGRAWTAAISCEPIEFGRVMAVARPLSDRVQRGEHRYTPW
ncbi:MULTISPECIES: hypothetical protein [Cryobacterium]|uniref:Uncharacterized protein n=1 Tax=Cryobacterium breve TaxID=1259258 RepID=A0ABY2J2Q4_9MICO|nr:MULTISPECIES: hypothetical protein [Cryobacterium]TFC90900.1 hypothetical protein E3T20_14805 [Cryobacterium sp. TmT3-12]TFC99219.1 hypothetical protein E3O65_05940 [Cryobacterium breve]